MKAQEHSIRRRGQSLRNRSDHQLLAILLEWAGMTPLASQEAARSLLEEKETLAQVLASPEDLIRRFRQPGWEAAQLLALYAAAIEYYLLDKASLVEYAALPDDIYRLLIPHFFKGSAERLCTLYLGPSRRFISRSLFTLGEKATVAVTRDCILREAVDLGARAIIIAHNHPDGIPVFSENDRRSTLVLARQLSESGVRLADHFLFADARMYSLRAYLGMDLMTPWPPPPPEPTEKRSLSLVSGPEH